VELSKRDLADLLRTLGAILFAVGAAVWLLRGSISHETNSLERFLILLLPAVILYELALRSESPSPRDRARPSTSVLAIAAILLGTGALFAFTSLVGASTSDTLYGVAVFALSGLLAAYTARRLRVAYAALFAGLAALLSWEIMWEVIIPHESAGAARWLLILAAVLLFATAVRLARAGAIGSRELATVGGFTAVAAGVQGVLFDAVEEFFGGLGAVKHGGHRISGSIFNHHAHSLQNFGWDLYLLVVSALLVWLGARTRSRGLGYVGGVGLIVFIVDVSVRLSEGGAGQSASNALAGWPLALLLVGTAGLAAPRLFRDE
jgi:hypothetical protein